MKKYFAECKTKEEAKKVYTGLAQKYHPDKGGDTEIMKAINIEYDEVKNSLPTLQHFDEQKKTDTDFLFYIKADELKAGIIQAGKIESCITFMVSAKGLIIMPAHYGKLSASVTIPAKVTGKGIFSIGAKILANVAGKFGKKEIRISHEKNSGYIEIGGMTNATIYKLTVSTDSTLDCLPDYDTSEFYLTAETLKIIGQIIFAADENNFTPIFNGINVKIDKNVITAQATNKNKLAKVASEFIGKCPNIEFNLPRKSAESLMKMIDEVGDEEKIGITTGKMITFRIGNKILTSELLDGEFPQTDKIFNQKAVSKIEILPEEIMPVLLRAKILARNNVHKDILIESGANGLTIKTNNPDIGNFSETVPAHISGKNFKLYYNINYLIDALKVLSNESDDGVIIELTSHDFLKIHSEVDTGFDCVVAKLNIDGCIEKGEEEKKQLKAA